jgi:hypothetical protein
LSNCISQQFSNLFNAYKKAFNNKYNRKGSLFTPNFERKIIDSEEYCARLTIYIHNNPVYHGFVKSPNEWPYSSWRAYLLDKNANVEIKEGLDWFGGIGNFKALHSRLKQEKLSLIWKVIFLQPSKGL